MLNFYPKAAALGVALALGASAAASAQAAPIVIVNIDRVYADSAAGKYAIAQMKPQIDQLQQRQRSYQEQFQREGAGIQQQAAAPKPATPALVAQRERDLQAKVRDLQQREQTAQTELGTRQRQLQATNQSVIQQINDAMNPIVTTIMKEKGAIVAMPTGATLQAAASVDVTAEVISRLDRALPRVNVTAPAAAPAR